MEIFRVEPGTNLWFFNGKSFSFMFWFSWGWPFINVSRGHRVGKEG